ncbi:MAG: PorV/PorQ family protein, partial [candidate division Zixibacteria bacterium]|nr:PorV/PorQ family protein [candidate division Zixibacteria bacterium]
SIAATDEYLLVGTNSGLVAYDGKRWRTITVADGLPSDTIECLYARDNEAYIGTNRGLARFVDYRLAEVQGAEQIPDGSVMAVGFYDSENIWIVLDNDLYYYDGSRWSNSMDYQLALDETPEIIAQKFALYGTAPEMKKYLEKYTEANLATGGRGVKPNSAPKVDEAQQEMSGNIMDMVAAGKIVSDTTIDTTAIEEPVADEDTTEVLPDDSELATVETESDTGLTPGMIVQIPFLAEIKGKVNSIFAGPERRVWIATDYGLLYFDGKSWTMPGYRSYRLKEGDTFKALLGAKRHKDSAAVEEYAMLLTDINDLDEETLEKGKVVKIYRNPAAARITRICRSGEKLYFTTDAGLIEYDGYYWARSNIRGMDRARMVDAVAFADELWLASEEKIVTKANALKQLTLMHVKWLPELTDDVYYEFISYVSSGQDWGTFGGNITFISYGEFMRTGEMGDTLGSFDSFDIAFTGSYGTAISPRLKVGLSAKLLYSKLSDLGTGLEKGRGTSSGFALDFGLLYQMTKRLTWGAALTNIGPSMAYIDAAQSDNLPRNLSLGLAYKLLQTDYYHLLVTAEVNKIMVGLDDGVRKEMEQLVLNSGAEFLYSRIFALRAGYVHDEEGDVKMMTLGVGLALFDTFKFDFSYIPSNSTESLRNTLRISVSILP